MEKSKGSCDKNFKFYHQFKNNILLLIILFASRLYNATRPERKLNHDAIVLSISEIYYIRIQSLLSSQKIYSICGCGMEGRTTVGDSSQIVRTCHVFSSSSGLAAIGGHSLQSSLSHPDHRLGFRTKALPEKRKGGTENNNILL